MLIEYLPAVGRGRAWPSSPALPGVVPTGGGLTGGPSANPFAVGMTTIFAAVPPASSRNRPRTFSGRTPPPQITRAPPGIRLLAVGALSGVSNVRYPSVAPRWKTYPPPAAITLNNATRIVLGKRP